jgi:arabinogalactan endo-1,4-beta-galactosidase
MMINAGAIGVVYWEPAWITSKMTDLWNTGSAWENCAFFNFSGILTEAVDFMKHSYTSN